jgi:hypothetical protein
MKEKGVLASCNDDYATLRRIKTKENDSMTGFWSVTQCAFASCTGPMSTTLEQGATEASKTMEELPQTPMTMESDHGIFDSHVCEEGIEMELDKPPYHANTIREDAHFHGMIDATKDDNDDKPSNLAPVEV